MINQSLTVYTYPDGSQGYNRPIDRQMFVTYDKNQNMTGYWQWDDFKGHWLDISNNRKQTDDPDTKAPESLRAIVKKKCECGAEKIDSSNHSNWCPKH